VNCGWSDPIDQLGILRDAVRSFLHRRPLSIDDRFDRATAGLAKYSSEDFPTTMRATFERLMRARHQVLQEYVGASRFEFHRLKPADRQALIDDIASLYGACLLDIGRADLETYDIVYPADGSREGPT
jgi:hypothetical protein